MSNIYLIIEKLEKLQSSNEFTHKQKTFIKTLLEGKKDNWRPLNKLAENPIHTEIKNIISSIEEEIKNNSGNSYTDLIFYSTYTKLLYKCLSNFRGMDAHMNLAAHLISKDKFKDFAGIFDNIFQKTTIKYNGNIILPICQGLDVRLGDSNGECHGYFCHWASGILGKKSAFGINIDDPISFKPIKLDSAIGKKIVEWNHLAILNKNVSHYQRHQPDKVKTELRKFNRFYLSTYTISKKLLTEVNKCPDKVYELQIFGGILGFSGHALGFCKRGNQFHFFDSNSMWVSFNRQADFELWLSYYFESIGYDKVYNEYSISSYESTTEVELDFKKKMQILFVGKDKTKSNIEIAATAITFSITAPIVSSYFFVARPIIHAAVSIGKQCKNLINHFNNDAQSKELLSEPCKQIRKSMDDLDIVKRKSNKISFLDSTNSLAVTLDIELQNVQQAKSNLIENNNKIKFFKSKQSLANNFSANINLSNDINLSEFVITNYF